jgi:hypothetical protein
MEAMAMEALKVRMFRLRDLPVNGRECLLQQTKYRLRLNQLSAQPAFGSTSFRSISFVQKIISFSNKKVSL